MAYTGTNVATKAQRFLADISDDAYIDDILSYINEGQKRFASETHCCQKHVDVAVTAQTIPFTDIVTAMGSDAENVLYVVKLTPKIGSLYAPLHKAPMSEMKTLLAAATTTPTRYSIFAESVIFDTHPDTTLSFTITIDCSFVPVDLAALSNNIIIPDEWVHALVKYVVFCCRIQDRDAGLANGAYQEFETIKQHAANVFMSQIEKIPGVA